MKTSSALKVLDGKTRAVYKVYIIHIYIYIIYKVYIIHLYI